MPPHVTRWNCASCLQSVTVAAADASSQVSSGIWPKCPDCQEEMTPRVIQWHCPDCGVYTTLSGLRGVIVCARCFDEIGRPFEEVLWCPECGAPVHHDCIDDHCTRTHWKRFDWKRFDDHRSDPCVYLTSQAYPNISDPAASTPLASPASVNGYDDKMRKEATGRAKAARCSPYGRRGVLCQGAYCVGEQGKGNNDEAPESVLDPLEKLEANDKMKSFGNYFLQNALNEFFKNRWPDALPQTREESQDERGNGEGKGKEDEKGK